MLFFLSKRLKKGLNEMIALFLRGFGVGLFVLLASQLLGCSQIAFGPCHSRIYSGECDTAKRTIADADLITTNYQAADRLIANTLEPINPQRRILVTTLADLNDLDTSTPLGRLIGEQLSARLVEHGFTIVEAKLHSGLFLIPKTGEFVLSRTVRELRELGHTQLANQVVAGTYVVGDNKIYITLKLLDFWDSRVTAAYSYTLPLGANTALLLKNPSWWPL